MRVQISGPQHGESAVNEYSLVRTELEVRDQKIDAAEAQEKSDEENKGKDKSFFFQPLHGAAKKGSDNWFTFGSIGVISLLHFSSETAWGVRPVLPPRITRRIISRAG